VRKTESQTKFKILESLNNANIKAKKGQAGNESVYYFIVDILTIVQDVSLCTL
jgi:hypothetical protein